MSLSEDRVYGSSPRMWGTQIQNPAFSYMVRFIPTHVGNTETSTTPSTASSVHPHACGEHSPAHRPVRRLPGSSPRMWGTRDMRDTPLTAERFIPTHVGNTPE